MLVLDRVLPEGVEADPEPELSAKEQKAAAKKEKEAQKALAKAQADEAKREKAREKKLTEWQKKEEKRARKQAKKEGAEEDWMQFMAQAPPELRPAGDENDAAHEPDGPADVIPQAEDLSPSDHAPDGVPEGSPPADDTAAPIEESAASLSDQASGSANETPPPGDKPKSKWKKMHEQQGITSETC